MVMGLLRSEAVGTLQEESPNKRPGNHYNTPEKLEGTRMRKAEPKGLDAEGMQEEWEQGLVFWSPTELNAQPLTSGEYPKS